MAKLTDTQLIVLSKAAARDDCAGVIPDRMNRAAAAKVGSSLVGRKLMREIRTKPGWLPHTTRAALTCLRKRGFVLERIRHEAKGSLYRIVQDPKQAIRV